MRGAALLLLVASPAAADVFRFTVAQLPACDVVNHAKVVWLTDPTDDTDCTVGAGTAPPHQCTCVFDVTGAWTAGNLGTHEATLDLELRDNAIDFDAPDVTVVHVGDDAGVMTIEPLVVEPPDVPAVTDGRAVRPVVDLSGGCHASYCTGGTECGEGQGSCTTDAHCIDTPDLLFCRPNVGRNHGCSDLTDICQLSSYWCTATCSPSELCLAGQGDCAATDANCLGGTVCEVDVGADWGCGATVDVCERGDAVCDSGCTPGTPCLTGFGDCAANDSACTGSRTCDVDTGAYSGCAPDVDICIDP